MKNSQKGAVVIMEAAFVFPIMFIVILAMLMACEAYWQYARVERACVVASIRGAARCENPMLEYVQQHNAVPTGTADVEIRPYRYILTGESKNIAADVAKELREEIEAMDSMAFLGIKPTKVSVTIQPKMNVLVSSFPVDCTFQIKLPIRMIFSNEDIAFNYSIHVSEPVGDPAEFIRNVSTVQDYLERTKLYDTIQEYSGKIKDALSKLAQYTN